MGCGSSSSLVASLVQSQEKVMLTTPFEDPSTSPPSPPRSSQQERGSKMPNRKLLERSASVRDNFCPDGDCPALTIIVLGASGDLAKKKTFPALYALHSKGFLSQHVQMIGYARSQMNDEELRGRLRAFLPQEEAEKAKVAVFLSQCFYVKGDYDGDDGYAALNKRMLSWEAACGNTKVGRLFYLALPPTTYPTVCGGLNRNCIDISHAEDTSSWYRCIMEKPFGHDLDSSEDLADFIGKLFTEEHLYRIDHYLGKELVQNMLVLRFSNSIMQSWWNRDWISNIQISFKEPFGTQGRGGYFDQYGIVRDVIQNHLVQVMTLMCMESPVSMHPDDIRDEKVKVLRQISVVKPEDCIIGQYTAANGNPGYLDDETVPAGSKQATYAAVKLEIKNERWAGVPIMIKAGKALNERLAAIRIQLKPPPASIFGPLEHMRNELVIKFQPGEAIYAKLVIKKPGLEMEREVSELDLTIPERYANIDIPDAYERLILDCLRGDQQHFVRRDELRAAWAIFTPLLHSIDKGELEPEPYEYGGRGPASVDPWTAKNGYVKTEYEWHGQKKE